MSKMKSKVLSFLLSVCLVVTFIPTIAFAGEGDIVTDDGAVVEADQPAEGDEANVTDPEEVVSEPEEDVSEPEEVVPEAVEDVSEPEEVISDVDAFAAEDPLLKEVTIGSGTYSAVVKQKDINYGKMNITIPNYTKLKNAGITSVQVLATLNYDGNVTWSKSKTKTIDEIAGFEGKYTMNFSNFGHFQVKVIFKKDSKAYKTVSGEVDVIAEEYNLAPIVATYPVTLFTLDLQNICKKDDGTPVPTFISLQRPDAYNWDNLPENCYWQPNLTKDQVKKQTNFDTKTKKFADYIADLYAANPNAKFNLYINDAYPKYELLLLCANGISADQYTVTLISDGAGTYSHYINCFNVDDPQAKYNEMATAWATVKAQVTADKKYSLNGLPYYSSSNYAVVLTNEDENTSWWVGRKNKDTFTLSEENQAFTEKYITDSSNRVNAKNTWNMCQALTEEQQAVFKALYHFNDSMFAEAEKTGKKAMMILGSRVTSEPNFGAFKAYAKFLMNQYGHEDYVYYYKGHPGTPTKLYPDKQKDLDELGITDVESSIAAELILFFYPDIYMAGYSSTTFQSVESPEMATGVFGKTREQAESDASVGTLARDDVFQFYMSHLTDSVDAYPGIDASHDNYLVEFQAAYLEDQGNKYDFAVYDFTDDVIYYFKAGEPNTLVEVMIGQVTGSKGTLNFSKKTIVSEWNAIKVASGYEIQYKTSKDGAWKKTTATKNSKTFSNLKNGQILEFKVRAFRTINESKFYGDFSSVSRLYVRTTSINKISSPKKKQLQVVVKKQKNTTGYQVLYSKNKSFKDASKKSVRGASKTTILIKSVPSGNYYVKVRPYKKFGTKVYYGQYSGTKTIKVK